jgi:acetolactate synthase, large subunit (EC 2.2.1.6)
MSSWTGPSSVTPRLWLCAATTPLSTGNRWQIRKAAGLIAKAKKPVLYVGGGVISSDSHAELAELVALTKIPVTLTLMGLGAYPGNDPLFMGMLGMHGTYTANMAVHHSDLLIAVGVASTIASPERSPNFLPTRR